MIQQNQPFINFYVPAQGTAPSWRDRIWQTPMPAFCPDQRVTHPRLTFSPNGPRPSCHSPRPRTISMPSSVYRDASIPSPRKDSASPLRGFGINLDGDKKYDQKEDGYLTFDISGDGKYDLSDMMDSRLLLKSFRGDFDFNGDGKVEMKEKNQGSQQEVDLNTGSSSISFDPGHPYAPTQPPGHRLRHAFTSMR